MPLFAEYKPRRRDTLHNVRFQIRPANETDGAAIAHIQMERDGGTLEGRLCSFSRALADPETTLIVVAECGAKVVGFGRAAHFSPPLDAPINIAPESWYLYGVIVHPHFRRHSIGHALTQYRLEWIARRAPVAYYFANALNQASIDLHADFGFVEYRRDFTFPGVSFQGGTGILFRADL